MKRILLAVSALLLAIGAQRLITGDGWSAAALVCALACVLYLIALPRDAELFPLGHAGPVRHGGLLWAGVAFCLLATGLGVAGALRFRGETPEAGAWSLHLYSLAALLAGIILLDLGAPPERPDASQRTNRRPMVWVLGSDTSQRTNRRPMVWFLGAVAILLTVAAALRLSDLGGQPFGVWFDEATNALVARDILANPTYRPLYLTSTFHTAHHNYLVALAFQWFGDSIASARLVSALAGIGLVAAGALVGLEFFHTQPAQPGRTSYVARTMALLLAAALTISAWSLTFSRIAVNYIATPLFILLAVGFLLRGLRTQRLNNYALAGVAVGLGLNFYTSFRLFVPVLPIFVIALGIARRDALRESWRGLILAALAAALVAAPLLAFAASNRETFLKRTNDTYLLRDTPAEQRLEVLWRNTQRHLLMFNVRGDPNGRHNLPGRPHLDPWLAGLFVVGLAACLWRWRRPHSILLLAWFTLTLLGGIFTLDFEAPQSLRSNGAIAAAYVIALVPVAEVLRAWEKSQAGRYYPRTAAAMAALLIVPVAVWNLTGYYGVQRHDFAVWNAYSTPETITARTMAELDPATSDVFLVSYYMDHPTIYYLAPQWLDRAQQIESGQPPPFDWTPGKDAWIFLDADSEALYARLQAIYPGGEFEEHGPPFTDAVSLRTVHLTPDVIASAQGMLASYYAAEGLPADALGTPLTSERVPSAHTDWTTERPAPFPFVAEYTGVLRAPEYGIYDLRVEAPARAALWIDETQVLSGTGALEGALSLARGNHTLRLRLEGAPGPVSLQWATPNQDFAVIPSQDLLADASMANGLLGRFHAGDNWEGEPVLAVIDPQMNIFYHIVPLNRPFSAEWTGKVAAPVAGDYLFAMDAIDWAQLWIDGELVLETEAPDVTAEGQRTLSEGLHDIRILYRAQTSHNRINLWWVPPGGARAPIPNALLFPPRGSYEAVEIPSFALLEPALAEGPPDAAQTPDVTALPAVITTVATGLNRPAGVAVTPDGLIFVANTGSDQLLLYDAEGATLRTIVGGAAPFAEPFDVAADGEGNAYLLDPEAADISVFAGNGEFLRTIAPDSTVTGRSRGIDVADDGSIWIANTAGQRIIRLDADGNVTAAFPAWEDEDAQVVDVAASVDGSLTATVMGIDRIVQYDADGNRLHAWSMPSANTVDGPHIAVGADGAIYVTQPEEGRVARYTPRGEADGYWQLPTDSDRMKPVGIALDGEGRIWVTDVEGGRLIRIEPDDGGAP